MKVCPRCNKQFGDRLIYCAFDGGLLYEKAGAPAEYETADFERFEARVNGWKVAFFVLLAIVLVGGGGLAAYFLLSEEPVPPNIFESVRPAVEAKTVEPPKELENPETLTSITELPAEELLEILPKNLMRRFHAGEPSQGKPDDHRVIEDEKGEFVVLIGAGKISEGDQVSSHRILILQFGENQFRDLTKQLLPPAYSRGIVSGRMAQVEFESDGPAITVREPASSNAVVNECLSCEHAYQQVRLEWKASRYDEAGRAWENDRYTAFYVAADALEKRRVDELARPLIEPSLDARIAEGFARRGREGWYVRQLPDSMTEDSCRYQMGNGEEFLTFSLAKSNDRWKVIRISDE
jgi:hypothetical protein